jgi:hypothetical protein
MNKLIAAVALATVLASPAFAQSYNPDVGTGNIVQFQLPAPAAADAYAHVRSDAQARSPLNAYGAVTPFAAPVEAANGGRNKAVQECSALAAPFKEMTWGTMQMHQYRTCMVQHGEAE